MKKKTLLVLGFLLTALLSISSVQPPRTEETIDLAGTGHIAYSEHKWSFLASVVRVEEVSALGSRGHAVLLSYMDERDGGANHVWVLQDLEGYAYQPGIMNVSAGQQVLVYIAGDYVNRDGIDYERCSNEAGDYCTILSLVEGAHPKSVDMHDLALSPGNKLIHHGSSSRNWWNGMLAWKMALP